MKRTMATSIMVFLILALGTAASASGPLLFDKTEYSARRAKMMERIPDGVAILLGAVPATAQFPQVGDDIFPGQGPCPQLSYQGHHRSSGRILNTRLSVSLKR